MSSDSHNICQVKVHPLNPIKLTQFFIFSCFITFIYLLFKINFMMYIAKSEHIHFQASPFIGWIKVIVT